MILRGGNGFADQEPDRLRCSMPDRVSRFDARIEQYPLDGVAKAA